MAFVTASTMTFVQIGFTDSPCGQRRGGLRPLIGFSPLLTIALSFFGPIARLFDRVVIVRVPSHPNDKANRQCYENKYNNYF